MLENLWIEQSQDTPRATGSVEKNTKKRKVQETTDDVDDDEDMYYSATAGKGKKPKGGIGYAGAVKEDVSAMRSHSSSYL